jgi:pyruvate,water dikinase
LVLGVDRDSEVVAGFFNEQDKAVKSMIASVIRKVKERGSKIGLCGQAPGDFPEFVSFLIEQGIDSISFNPDALLKGIEHINKKIRAKNAY